MSEINISNSAGRDAVVNAENVVPSNYVRWLDPSGRQAGGVRIIKSTTACDIDELLAKHGHLNLVADAIIESDPDVDLENAGRFLTDTSRVYVDQNQAIVRNIRFVEIVKNADGSVREERPRQLAATNVSGDMPLKWSGVFIRKDEAIRKFVFVGKSQLHHVNGLTFDFLYAMARELEDRNSLMLLGAGPKSNQPLILRRGGLPYRGFLEGRTDGDRYCLLLHYSNLELKTPKDEQE